MDKESTVGDCCCCRVAACTCEAVALEPCKKVWTCCASVACMIIVIAGFIVYFVFPSHFPSFWKT